MLSVPEMNLTSSFLLGLLEYALHLLLSPVTLQQVSPEAVGFRYDLQSSRPFIYSCEASIFRSSPSSRSESAMISAES